MRTHGLATRIGRSTTYTTWANAKQRAGNPNHPNSADYSGRGITMCAGYRQSFAAFHVDMGDRPEGHMLDRVDNDGGYWCGKCDECRANGWPFNLRWATRSQQMRNRRGWAQQGCAVPGCDRPHKCKTLCDPHYKRVLRARKAKP